MNNIQTTLDCPFCDELIKVPEGMDLPLYNGLDCTNCYEYCELEADYMYEYGMYYVLVKPEN